MDKTHVNPEDSSPESVQDLPPQQGPHHVQQESYGPQQSPYNAQQGPYDSQRPPYNFQPNPPDGQQVYGGYAPNPAYQQVAPKKKDGCLTAVIIAGLVAVLLGLGSCSFALGALSWLVEDSTIGQGIVEDIGDSSIKEIVSGIGSSEKEANNATLRKLLGQDYSTESFTASELENIQKQVFASSKTKEGRHPQGVYFVGKDIPAGDYWMEGNEEGLSYYFVLEKDDRNYNCRLSNNYYGHNLMGLNQGEVLVLVNGEGGFYPLSDMKQAFSDPYTNGVFRVGIDIPAGTYHLKPGKDYDNYSACYVMNDLSYDDDYLDQTILEQDRDNFSGREVTLKEGQYLELFNATATKGATA